MSSEALESIDIRIIDIEYDTDDWARPLPYSQLPGVIVAVSAEDAISATVYEALRRISSDRPLKYDPRRARTGLWLAFHSPGMDADALGPGSDSAAEVVYGVREDGTLAIGNDELSNVTWGDVRRAVESGYRLGDPRRWVIVPPHGQGGDWGEPVMDLLEFLAYAGVLVESSRGVFHAGRWLLRTRNRITDRDARRAAKAWKEGALEGPWDLSTWIDKRASWSASEVAQRLSLPLASSEELLKCLGYEWSPRSSSWIRSARRRARRRRAKWDRSVERFTGPVLDRETPP